MRRMLGMLMAGVIVVAMAGGDAQAGPTGAGHHGPGRGGGLLSLLRGVGLTEDQQAQVRQIVASHRPQLESLGGQLREAHEALRAKLLGPDPVTAADLAPYTQPLEQLRAQVAQEQLQAWLEVRAVLTPEQLARAAQIRRRLGELRSEARGLLGGR